MNKNKNITDRINDIMIHYSLNPNSFASTLGGSRTKIYNVIGGKVFPGYETLDSILNKFPNISAEWLFRGEGSMLKEEMISRYEMEEIIQENKTIKSLYKAELLGKPNGVSNHLRDNEGASEFLTATMNKNKFPYNKVLLKFADRYTSNQ